VVDATPQLIPHECWSRLWTASTEGMLRFKVKAPVGKDLEWNRLQKWHVCYPLPETAYAPTMRSKRHEGTVWYPGYTLADAQRLHALAPYDLMLDYSLLARFPALGAQGESNIYAPVLAYSSTAVMNVARSSSKNPDDYEHQLLSLAEKKPAKYFDLAGYFASRNEEEKAAVYYQKGYDLCSDRVKASYYAEWLVKYDLKKGEVEKARTIAEEAGAVYSSAGLTAQAQFYEGTHDYAKAFECYQNIFDRYDEPAPLLDFGMRYRDEFKDDRFLRDARNAMLRLFPEGIREVSMDDFHASPTNGVLVAGENTLMKQAGLHYGDVIVAVNGVPVQTFKQYSAARQFKSDPDLHLIVWQRDQQYHQIVAAPPKHVFGVTFVDYK
jgi:hypothetical protein